MGCFAASFRKMGIGEGEERGGYYAASFRKMGIGEGGEREAYFVASISSSSSSSPFPPLRKFREAEKNYRIKTTDPEASCTSPVFSR